MPADQAEGRGVEDAAAARRLLVGGLHAGGAGYPNAEHTLRIVRERLGVEVVECGSWLPASMHLWRLAERGGLRMANGLLRLAVGNLCSLLRVLWRSRRAEGPVYVPYPAVFLLWWASWLPRRLRPRLIADAYVSLWDSQIRDRGRGREGGAKGALLKALERRALRAADTVLVDTEANRRMYVEAFGLAPERVRSLPLAIDESLFLTARRGTDGPRGDRVTVLFVGTMIPLHGVEVILEAMQPLLAADPRLHFRLIGDGQLGELIARSAAGGAGDRVAWVRGWQGLERIAQEIADADICLGVFGGREKTARVLPFKVYMYLAAGKAVISQAALSLPKAAPFPPMLTVPPGDAGALAAAVATLAADPARREQLGTQARAYFSEQLGAEAVSRAWRELLG